ncbi:MAG: FecR domain-containing protein [Deltaproteobacteria bacterium]|nr:FecR domain-containing protein [Deltaproteobacteria bacterium]
MRHVRDDIPMLVAGSLPQARDGVVRRHLRTCGACASEFERELAFTRALAGDPDVPSPREVRQIMARACAVDRPPVRRVFSRSVPVVLAMLCAAGAAVFLVAPQGDLLRRTADTPAVATGSGIGHDEGRSVALGTWLEHPDTRIGVYSLPRGGSLELSGRARFLDGARLELAEGSAALEVTPGRGGFEVVTQYGWVAVVGTRFVVELQEDRVRVEVLDGAVDVFPSRPATPPLRLTAGMSAWTNGEASGVEPAAPVWQEPRPPQTPPRRHARVNGRAEAEQVAGRLVAQANEALLAGAFGDAERLARTAAELSRGNAEAYRVWGYALHRLGRPCDAAAQLRRSLKLEASGTAAEKAARLLRDASFARCD